MKRIIAILCVCLLLTGCATRYEDAEEISKKAGGGYFITIKSWNGEGSSAYQIVYANDTKVKYLIWESAYNGGITPLYNSDGSLQIYEGE